VKSLPHDKLIVLYCGCCPWGHCPNVRPAYHQLNAMGFNHVKVLYIANNFGTDWVDKGYPTIKGQ
jgi:thiosulfate/3-mercaptopyruvate sulfurtransferase